MTIESGWTVMTGRWFTGAYDETGIDVRLVRLGSEPTVLGASVSALKAGAAGQTVTIFGANLPTTIAASDIGFGQGVKVNRVVSSRADAIAVELDVAPNAVIGPRDLAVGGAVRPSALVIYDKIDALRVVPQAGLARIGGVVAPKQFQQFEAVGISNGPDRKPGTADDLNVGAVEVKWSIEEYTATFADDDVRYVGAIGADGLFTPNIDGPNPNRSGNRDNVGDVWVVADLANPAAVGALQPLRGRAHLLVTVPIYIGWFESEGQR